MALNAHSTLDDEGRWAIIDIGSNSVRLVIYDGPRRAPFPICNEKALCGLGRDMDDDGTLNPQAVDAALAVLARFKTLLAEHGDPPTRVVATAAVREASNGQDFVEAVERVGFAIEVILGTEEARLSGLGVISFEPEATGLVGDMGGGSLELICLDNGEIREAASLSIGPFRLMKHSGGDQKVASKEAETAIGGIEWLKRVKTPVLYAVGGAWRAIARINMQLRHHPLSVLHHYEISARQVIETCELVARQSRSSLEETPGVSSKRIDTLPYAALVLRSVMISAECEKMVVSAGGLREGLLYDALGPETRQVDPLLAGARYLGRRFSPDARMGDAAAEFTNGIFKNETSVQKRLRVAACLLTDAGAYFHPDLRSIQAFETALRAPFYGVTHPERAMVALSLFCRHEGANGPFPEAQILAMLTEEERKRAIEVGLALRFVSAFAPKAPNAIEACFISHEAGRLSFIGPTRLKSLMDDVARRRLESLAALLGAKASVSFV
ncbi:MAG: Ppx/GppA family phosphatase [Parvularculaceae bacterium]|nr:Ppx/GppA family phosphatase [Parvularculaceae bacterium]